MSIPQRNGNICSHHHWDVDLAQARAIQLELAQQVCLDDQLPQTITHVAGVDVGFEANGTITRAAVAVLSFPELVLVDSVVVREPTRFPYIPGYLSFRELPAILKAYENLVIRRPELILCDGQGIAHPRRLGIAAHLGVILDMPTIGVAKTRLVGTHRTPPQNKGSWVPLYDHQTRIGAVVCTRNHVKPLYISTGHRISLETAISYVLACTTRYRLPETTRYAHRLASRI